MHHPTDRIAHTTAFVTPVVEHWLEREIAQWVHPMKDRSDNPSHHERTLLPRSYVSLHGALRVWSTNLPRLGRRGTAGCGPTPLAGSCVSAYTPRPCQLSRQTPATNKQTKTHVTLAVCVYPLTCFILILQDIHFLLKTNCYH